MQRVSNERLNSAILDLGDRTTPVLVFGGPYGNVQALTALFAVAEQRGVSGDNMICTGDLAAYCADAQATIDLIRARGVHVIAGNVEESLGADSMDCGCGFDEGGACDVLASSWYGYAVRTINAESKQWMASLPGRAKFSMAGARLSVIHGGVDQTNKFIFPGAPCDDLRDEFRRAGCDGVIAGHSGAPFSRLVDGRLWHNAGAIGMPANDGTPRVWYSVLSPKDDGGVDIEIHALSYDWREAAVAVREAGMPSVYADALETGLWPNDDIMPARDRAQRGMALQPSRMLWSLADRAARPEFGAEGVLTP